MQVHFYRFSVAWSRILPNGKIANVNEGGIDYYNRYDHRSALRSQQKLHSIWGRHWSFVFIKLLRGAEQVFIASGMTLYVLCARQIDA